MLQKLIFFLKKAIFYQKKTFYICKCEGILKVTISVETLNNLYNKGILNYVPYELCNAPAVAPMYGSPMGDPITEEMRAYAKAPGGYNYGNNIGYGDYGSNIDVSMYKTPGVVAGGYNLYSRNGYNAPLGVNTTVTVPPSGYYVQNAAASYADSANPYGHAGYIQRGAAVKKSKPGFFTRLKARRQNKMNEKYYAQQGGFDVYEKYNSDSYEYSSDKSKIKSFWQNNSAVLRGLVSLAILTIGGIIFCKKIKKPKKLKP